MYGNLSPSRMFSNGGMIRSLCGKVFVEGTISRLGKMKSEGFRHNFVGASTSSVQHLCMWAIDNYWLRTSCSCFIEVALFSMREVSGVHIFVLLPLAAAAYDSQQWISAHFGAESDPIVSDVMPTAAPSCRIDNACRWGSISLLLCLPAQQLLTDSPSSSV